jgi:hypothetical protein
VRLAPDAADADIRAAANARGIDPKIVDAALGAQIDLLAAGRALQQLERMEAKA